MKKSSLIFFLLAITILIIVFNSCASLDQISEKSGALLWVENCNRCHVIPPPTAVSQAKWDIIGTHMKIRANLTSNETQKIVEFLKMSSTNQD